MTIVRCGLWSISLLSLGALLGGCKRENTTAPVNNDPVIASIHAFPMLIAPSDSFAVFCSAYEPDGDSIFYNWSCTSGRVQGSSGFDPRHLNNTTENVRVFYAPDSSDGPDSIRVDVDVRDGKGYSASAWVLVGLSR